MHVNEKYMYSCSPNIFCCFGVTKIQELFFGGVTAPLWHIYPERGTPPYFCSEKHKYLCKNTVVLLRFAVNK